MGILDKLAFWKKSDDGFGDFDKEFGSGNLDMGNDSFGQQNFGNRFQPNQTPPNQMGRNTGLGQNMNMGMPDDIGFGNMDQQHQQNSPDIGRPVEMQQPFGSPIQPSKPSGNDYSNDKFEVISAKLDSLRYTLESINQRLTSLERLDQNLYEMTFFGDYTDILIAMNHRYSGSYSGNPPVSKSLNFYCSLFTAFRAFVHEPKLLVCAVCKSIG